MTAKLMLVAFQDVRVSAASELTRIQAFLASEKSAYIQGAIWEVEGGATRTL